ncbi:MAG TPA: SHOCT domain-containing protein [Bryobacteraceae bacterium]|nr:SHOCT domain-containing protein [Bryobacteraceae bacterium]HXJ43282.1 SHOCT domain-containing protein [Bryobacteraceae bacterium]
MSVAIELEKLKNLRDSGSITSDEFERSKTRLLDQCVRRIEAFYDGKSPSLPRWGLPPAKVVRGPVQSIRFSQGEGKHPYSAFLNVDGCGAEIHSSTPISMDAGDRVILGGYECDGRMLALAFHNESNGTYSNLNRLRRGYQLMLAVGALSLLAGVVVIAGAVILPFLQKPIGDLQSAPWLYARYAFAGLAAVAIGYFGVSLSFLGARAKEFHDAMTSFGSVSFTGYFQRSPAMRV